MQPRGEEEWAILGSYTAEAIRHPLDPPSDVGEQLAAGRLFKLMGDELIKYALEHSQRLDDERYDDGPI